MDKIHISKKYDLFELFNDLDIAEKWLGELCRDHTRVSPSVKEFNDTLTDEVYDLKRQNIPDFNQICSSFAPTSIWDDCIGVEGRDLANRIYRRAIKWNEDQTQRLT